MKFLVLILLIVSLFSCTFQNIEEITQNISRPFVTLDEVSSPYILINGDPNMSGEFGNLDYSYSNYTIPDGCKAMIYVWWKQSYDLIVIFELSNSINGWRVAREENY